MSAQPAYCPPLLGRTVDEVLEAWKQLQASGDTHAPGMRLVGWVVDEGLRFDWMEGRLWRLHAPGEAPSLRTPASPREIFDLERAIERGGVQIQSEPVPGLTGSRITKPLGVRVYHQATGRPLGEI
ncbi:MAG: hypothetical protein D6775_14790 [Caldilineae bacterium]|nr:MAG: hypothetical protein D6775_14790 [Caldilineae bacterium]